MSQGPEPLDAQTRRAADRLLLRSARHGAPWVAVLGVTALGLASAEVALPAVMGRAIDAALTHRAAHSWLTWFAVLVALMVICDALDDLAVAGTGARSVAWLRRTLVGHILQLEPRVVNRFGAGEIAARVVGNTVQTGRFASGLVRACVNLIPGLGGVIALGLIDPWLCATLLAGLPITLLLVRRFVRDVADHAAGYLRVQGQIAARLVEAVSGARTIAAAGTVDRETKRVLEPLPELHRHGLGGWRAQRRLSSQDALVVPLLEVAVLAVAGVEFAHGRITVGQFLAAGQYVLLASYLGASVGFVAQLVNVRASAARIVEILREPTRSHGSQRPPAGGGALEFRNATVRAGEHTLLDRIDLVVPAGTMAAVVGPTGAGKSLLAELAGRLVDPDAGEVRLDGVPLPRLSRRDLREAVGFGFARPALIGDQVADVLGFGATRPPTRTLIGAARAARADEFIRRLPRRYRTSVADAPMSGGEVQRIGLARAFAHGGRLLILDDVATNLDTVTEHEIGNVLAGAFSDRTRLVIAHRAATAARADLVIWLDAGRLRAVASHEQLWADPEYRSVFQASESSVGEPDAVPIAGAAA